jgi:hypothetical protein
MDTVHSFMESSLVSDGYYLENDKNKKKCTALLSVQFLQDEFFYLLFIHQNISHKTVLLDLHGKC